VQIAKALIDPRGTADMPIFCEQVTAVNVDPCFGNSTCGLSMTREQRGGALDVVLADDGTAEIGHKAPLQLGELLKLLSANSPTKRLIP
jgi:hypothetical protein